MDAKDNRFYREQEQAPEIEITLEQELFSMLARYYVQHFDQRQAEMGLQYTNAETHDLAKVVARFIGAQGFTRGKYCAACQKTKGAVPAPVPEGQAGRASLDALIQRFGSVTQHEDEDTGAVRTTYSFRNEWLGHFVDAVLARAAFSPASPVSATPRGTDAQILKERELTASAILGVIAYGQLGWQEPPNDSAWLRPFYDIGKQLAATPPVDKPAGEQT